MLFTMFGRWYTSKKGYNDKEQNIFAPKSRIKKFGYLEHPLTTTIFFAFFH